jgi:phosphoglycerate dehydrogenase-like enzyme
VKILYVPFRDLLHPWLDDVVEPLDGRCDLVLCDAERPFGEQVDGTSVVVDQGGWGTHEMIDAAVAAGVSLWQVLGTGLDHFDVEYALARGLRVANTPGAFSATALAEQAVLFMLCFAKSLDRSRENARIGRFYHPLNDDLFGRTLGIVGFGASGRALARRAACFEMRLLAVDVVEIDESARESHGLAFAGGPDDLDRLLLESDYVSLHVPLTPETEGLLDARRIALLRPSAVVINVARGALLDEEALVAALRDGRIRGAGLDVFAEEPLPGDHPLLELENVVATPHIAGGSRTTSRLRGATVADNVLRVLDGRPILHEIAQAER